MTQTFEVALRAELMAAARRPQRSHRRLIAAAAVASAAAVLTAVAPMTNPAAAGVKISQEDGRTTVYLTDYENTPEAIEDAVGAAGLDIQVEAVPTGPSHVGRFVGDVADAEDVVDLDRVEADGVTFVGFSLPEAWTGTLTLLLGRPAKPGEAYRTFTDAYAPGEPLACTGTFGRPLQELEGVARGLSILVRQDVDGSFSTPRPLARALAEGLGDEPVLGAVAGSSTSVLVDVGDLGDQPPKPEPAPC